jgi:hypothetical protein
MSYKDNLFFKVEQPVLVLKLRGYCETNTHIGRSMALTTVKEAVNAVKGDEIHALVGGTFLVRKDGSVSEVALVKAKHVFEKSYGGHVTDRQRLEAIAKNGSIVETETPKSVSAYRPEKLDERFPKLHAEIIWTEHSPLHEDMKFAFPDVMSASKGADGVKASIRDFDEDREVVVDVRDAEGYLFSVGCHEADERVSIKVSERFAEATGIINTLADSLAPDAIRTKSDNGLYLVPGQRRNLFNIQSHLGMALEEFLDPAPSNSAKI